MSAAPERRDDEEARKRELEERIRAMQFEQIPLEDGKPKARVGLVSAYVVTLIAAVLPLRVRTAFGWMLNFVFNSVTASFRFVAGLLSRSVTNVAIALVYWLVLGPTAIVARLFRLDDLRTQPVDGSMFQDKDPADATEERFSRQY